MSAPNIAGRLFFSLISLISVYEMRKFTMKAISGYRIVVLFSVIAALLVGTAATASAATASAAYPSVYTNYEKDHDIRNITDASHTFSFVKNSPGERFRIFIPPGATYVSVMLYASRNALIGAAARLDLAPSVTTTPA